MVIIEQEKFWMGKYGLSYAKRDRNLRDLKLIDYGFGWNKDPKYLRWSLINFIQKIKY